MDSQVVQWTHSWNYFKSLLSLGGGTDAIDYGGREITILRGHCIILKISTTSFQVKGFQVALPSRSYCSSLVNTPVSGYHMI